MEALLLKLRACRRQLELEDSLPYWEQQKPELKARISEMTENLQKKEQELENLENTGFFRRLFCKTDVRREKLSTQIREIVAAQTAAQWELNTLENRIDAGKQELKTLADSRNVYEAAKAAMVATAAQESYLMMEEISAFAPFAMENAERVLESLEGVRPWLEQEKGYVQQLQNIEAAAKRLHDILSVLPEGAAPVGSFLQEPAAFWNDGSLQDRLNQAQEQVQRVINQLRLLLGE